MPRAAPAEIRHAELMDSDEIATLHATCFKRGWSVGEIEDLLRDPAVFALVATRDSPAASCAGFLIARTAADEAEILTIATEPDLRRHGIARALVEAACKAVQHRGASNIFLEVAAANTAARALYGACGFAQVGHRPHYYGPTDGDDACVLRRTLKPAVDEHATAS